MIFRLAASALLALGLAAPALAATTNLIGDTVTADYAFGSNASDIVRSATFVVGAGAEIDCPSASSACGTLTDPISLDFTADTIVFNQGAAGFYFTGDFNGWIFSGLDYGTAITSVSLTSFGIPGLTDARVSFTADSITLDLQGFSVADPNGWTLTVNAPAPVPLPAGALLLLGGLGLFGLLRRRA